MTNEQLAKAIADGLLNTGVEGGFDAVTCSTAGDYPSMGCSQWEGIGGRGDYLLSWIDGGSHFAGRTYSDIKDSGELESLAELLSSDQGQAAQRAILVEDCMNKYLPYLEDILSDVRCIIYAGIWCPTSHVVVRKFIQRKIERGYDVNNLETLWLLFKNQYAIAADCEDYAEGYANRANNTYDYVANLDLSQYEGGC